MTLEATPALARPTCSDGSLDHQLIKRVVGHNPFTSQGLWDLGVLNVTNHLVGDTYISDLPQL